MNRENCDRSQNRHHGTLMLCTSLSLSESLYPAAINGSLRAVILSAYSCASLNSLSVVNESDDDEPWSPASFSLHRKVFIFIARTESSSNLIPKPKKRAITRAYTMNAGRKRGMTTPIMTEITCMKTMANEAKMKSDSLLNLFVKSMSKMKVLHI